MVGCTARMGVKTLAGCPCMLAHKTDVAAAGGIWVPPAGMGGGQAGSARACAGSL